MPPRYYPGTKGRDTRGTRILGPRVVGILGDTGTKVRDTRDTRDTMIQARRQLSLSGNDRRDGSEEKREFDRN